MMPRHTDLQSCSRRCARASFAILACAGLFPAGAAKGTATGAPARDWPTFNGSYSSERYSRLAEIDTENVGNLRRLCTFDTGEVAKSFESGPVVVDGVLYVTTDMVTYAVDAATCALRWKHTHRYEPPSFLGVNRGVAFEGGRLFRGSGDGHVFAIDAKTGRSLWDVAIADPARGETVPLAPVAWNGMVFAGNAGGDIFGVTGRVYALSAEDGRVLWQFDVVPDSGPARATWPASPNVPLTGGATWTSYSLDADRGILYIPTGNPAPDFALELRPGDNLYTNSVVALDARTGELLAFVQPTKNDFHDYDLAAAPALITTRSGQRLAIAAGKDGFVYGIDRSAVGRGGDPASPLAIRYRTAATTQLDTDTPLSTERGVRFCPGILGGTQWNGPAYHPGHDLVIVPAVDWCSTVKLAPLETLQPQPGEAWTGAVPDAAFGNFDPQEQWGGWLTAIDAETGHVRWRYRSPTPMLAGVTTTAGGLVFTGDLDGDFLAFDAGNGAILWREHIGQPMGAGVVTFEVDGRQRIAVGTGKPSPVWPVESDSARVVVFGLP